MNPKEKAFYQKARKIQKRREAKGRYIPVDSKTKIFIKDGEDETEKAKQYKKKVEKFRYKY